MEPTKGRFRGEEIDLCDARMMLTPDELTEVTVELEDGRIVRPFRFFDLNPKITVDDDGIIHF